MALTATTDNVVLLKDPNNHSGTTKSPAHDSKYHWTKWDCCGKVDGEKQDHSGGTATCQAKAICSTCNVAYGTLGAHNYDISKWGYTGADGHAHNCKTAGCTAHDTIIAHIPGPAATEDAAQTCTACGYELAAKLTHAPMLVEGEEATTTKPGKKVYYHCDGCGRNYEDLTSLHEIIGDPEVWRVIPKLIEVTSIAVNITEPTIGAQPDRDPTVATVPSGDIFESCAVQWFKIAAGNFTGAGSDSWTLIPDDYVFEEGYYYSPEIYCGTKDGYVITANTTATVNGEPHNKTFGEVFDEDTLAYISCVFTPLNSGSTIVIVEGNGQEWTKGTNADLTFKSTADFANFTRVEVDNKEVARENYTVTEGSTIVTLKASFLETLSVDEHTIVIVSANDTPAAKFTVKAAATGGNNGNEQNGGTAAPQTGKATNPSTTAPKTGDTNGNTFRWISALFVSLCGVAAIVAYKKRKAVK